MNMNLCFTVEYFLATMIISINSIWRVERISSQKSYKVDKFLFSLCVFRFTFLNLTLQFEISPSKLFPYFPNFQAAPSFSF